MKYRNIWRIIPSAQYTNKILVSRMSECNSQQYPQANPFTAVVDISFMDKANKNI